MNNDTSWITSVKYFKHEGENVSVTVTKASGGTCSVPMTTSNRHYQDVLAWVAKGNTIAEAN